MEVNPEVSKFLTVLDHYLNADNTVKNKEGFCC